jgi:hypothetical protein
MTKINISIPEPCHENWEAMTSIEKGKFCNACQKKVFDFTSSSDREIINAFHNDNNLCGRFLNSQLNRDLVTPKEKSTLWLATATALISLIGMNETTAQEKTPTEQTDQRALGKFIATPTEEEMEVSGVVSDRSGPLPGAIVTIKGTQKSVQTDFDGKYSIKANINDTIVVRFVGLIDTEILVKNSKQKQIILEEDKVTDKNLVITTLGGIKRREMPIQVLEGAVGMIEKKRTFFGRIFHSIGNWFR